MLCRSWVEDGIIRLLNTFSLFRLRPRFRPSAPSTFGPIHLIHNPYGCQPVLRDLKASISYASLARSMPSFPSTPLLPPSLPSFSLPPRFISSTSSLLGTPPIWAHSEASAKNIGLESEQGNQPYHLTAIPQQKIESDQFDQSR